MIKSAKSKHFVYFSLDMQCIFLCVHILYMVLILLMEYILVVFQILLVNTVIKIKHTSTQESDIC